MNFKNITILSIFFVGLLFSCTTKNIKIDRFTLVNRHNIEVNEFDSFASLSIGNGNFAFTTDFTGLQTFYKEYENGVTLGTQSNWGWHSVPNVNNYDIMESARYFETRGRTIPYFHQLKGGREEGAANYFRANPHRLHLGMIQLNITLKNGESIKITDVQNVSHKLNLWEGKITSDFEIEGKPVKVVVFCHQDLDMVSAKIESPLIESGQLSIQWDFPYGVDSHKMHPGYDFFVPVKHKSFIENQIENEALIRRNLDTNEYFIKLAWQQKSEFKKVETHTFILIPDKENNEIEFSCLFSATQPEISLPNFESTAQNSINDLKNFWESGGAVDFSECTDERAKELERRVILSQYLTKIQCSGDLPAQETGLTFNSWYGKFHLEMHWWHAAHFTPWNRPEYLERQMKYYEDIKEMAIINAQRQGFKGLRWPKMVGPKGQDSPSSVATYLIWQQPHYIYFTEQLYQNNPSQETLNKYKDLVFETAEFMADFPELDEQTGIYNLTPPLIPAQEHWSRETTRNPSYELSYWHWALTIAQEWRKRAGLEIDEKWEAVRNNLPAPFQDKGVYLGIEGATDSYTNPEKMRDHPMVLGTLGMLPLWDKVDENIMKNTLDTIMEKWDWPSTWGWDYPMVAMCATRLGKPEIAIDALLMDVQKNTYLKNGHNFQAQRLRIYLPGNGGILKAIALMCAGWEGCKVENPGFPKNGKWNVKWEGLNKDF